MTPTQGRDQATRLAPINFPAALAAAREVSAPWYACQALAWVARYAPETELKCIAAEALEKAARAQDPYQRVGASAWPVRALIEREQSDRVRSLLPVLLAEAGQIDNLASRSEALFLLFQAVFPMGQDVREMMFQSLLAAALPMRHWRQGRNLRYAVQMVAKHDMALARAICNSLSESKIREQLKRALERGDVLSPRPFFWSKTKSLDTAREG